MRSSASLQRMCGVGRKIFVGLSLAMALLATPALSQVAQTDYPARHASTKQYTWINDNFSSPAFPNSASIRFGNGDWVADTHFAAGAVSTSTAYIREPNSKSIRCFIDPKVPAVPAGRTEAGNFRAEIRKYQWHEPIPVNTEEWYGWSYFFPPTYVHDTKMRGVFFQSHAGRSSPPVALDHFVPTDYSGRYGSQIHVARNWGVYDDGHEKGIIPIEFKPGRWYDFVVRIVWDTEAGGRGETEMWINGEKVYSKKGGNTYDAGTDPLDTALPYGGTLKLGLYKWPWKQSLNNINASASVGVTKLEVYIGPVRTLRMPTGQRRGYQGYHDVMPAAPRPLYTTFEN